MKRSLNMALIVAVIAIFAAGCGEQQSSGYTREQIIEKYSRYIPRSQIEALLNGESSTDANAAVMNLVRYGVSDEFDRDVANMQ